MGVFGRRGFMVGMVQRVLIKVRFRVDSGLECPTNSTMAMTSSHNYRLSFRHEKNFAS